MRSPSSPPDPQLLLQHAGFIRGIARGLLVDASSADDVVQETWLAALRNPPRAGANLRAWLAVVTRNMAARLRRSTRRRGVHETRGAKPDGLPSAAELLARIEVQRRVLDAVERLEEPYRMALLYRYFDGLPPRTIAERLGVPVKTVKSRLNRALRTLREDLGRMYGGDDTKWSALLLPLAWPWPRLGTGGLAAAGGIALTMKKWTIAAALVLCLLGTTFVVWETRRDPEQAPKRAALARTPDAGTPGVDTTEDAAPAPAARTVLHEGVTVPAFTFAGRVVDAGGKGVKGAELRLVYWMAGTGEVDDTEDKVIRRDAERRERPAATTDGDGHFRLDRPYASKSHFVVRAEGFAPTVSQACEPGVFLLIQLTRGAPLRVTAVKDPGEEPVADAVVRLVTSPLGRSARVLLAEAKTDAQGVAELPTSQASDLWIEVDARDPALAAVQARVAAAQDAIVVKVPSQATKTVRITDGVSGAPVRDACVITCRGAGLATEERRRFPADADGRVLVPWAPNELRFATAPGYETTTVAAQEVQLWPAMRIEGRVVDEEGRPVEGAAILVASPPGTLFHRVFVGAGAVAAWSDDDGRFTLEDGTIRQGRPEDGVRSVIALHPGHAPAFADGVSVEAGGHAFVQLRFPAPATLELEVVDALGTPLKHQWVRVSRRIKPDDRGDGVNVVGLVHGHHTLTTDEHGRCEAGRLPPGSYMIRSESTTADVELPAGVTTRFKLVKGAGPVISGRVLRADGTPAVGVWVGVPGAPATSAKQTDADGRFRFTDMPDFKLADVRGGHTVQISMLEWRGSLEVPAKIGDDLVITLPAGPAKLRIETDLPPDVLVQYVLVTRTGGRAPAEKWAAGTSAFETEPFTPGTGLLVLKARGHGTAEVEFDAEAARTTVVHVSFPPPGSVEGAVGVREGVVRFVRLTPTAPTARRDDDLHRRLATTLRDAELAAGIGPDGAFRITEVPPGPYRAALFEANREVAARDIEVRSGEALTVPFDAN